MARPGVLHSAGDRHMVEFLPGYIRSPEELFRWGIIRTPVSYRIQRWRDVPQQALDIMAGRRPLKLAASGEEGVRQMRALVGLGDIVSNVNAENAGQVSNLALGAVVEANARFSRDEVRPLLAGAIPATLHGVVAQHVANQEAIVEAALTRNRDLAFQAVCNDPASGLPIDEAWAMFNEMLHASRGFLPGWGLNG